MIDRWELLRWLNSFDSQINDNTLSENAKKFTEAIWTNLGSML